MKVQKKILVTGASGGIGRAIAEAIAENGSIVALHYNSDGEAAHKLADIVSENGATPVLVQADLCEEHGRKKLLDELNENMAGCNILVNNAGGLCEYNEGGVYSEKEAAGIIGLNFLAPYFICQNFFPAMCQNGYGRIVNISSVGVKFGGGKDTLLYSASKAALELLTKHLSRLGAEHNVLVNTIRAGVIDTPFHSRNTPGKDMAGRTELIPLKRMGDADDIADMVSYLVSDRGDFITGETITVAGGE